jgi:hypothetical protein
MQRSSVLDPYVVMQVPSPLDSGLAGKTAGGTRYTN